LGETSPGVFLENVGFFYWGRKAGCLKPPPPPTTNSITHLSVTITKTINCFAQELNTMTLPRAQT